MASKLYKIEVELDEAEVAFLHRKLQKYAKAMPSLEQREAIHPGLVLRTLVRMWMAIDARQRVMDISASPEKS